MGSASTCGQIRLDMGLALGQGHAFLFIKGIVWMPVPGPKKTEGDEQVSSERYHEVLMDHYKDLGLCSI